MILIAQEAIDRVLMDRTLAFREGRLIEDSQSIIEKMWDKQPCLAEYVVASHDALVGTFGGNTRRGNDSGRGYMTGAHSTYRIIDNQMKIYKVLPPLIKGRDFRFAMDTMSEIKTVPEQEGRVYLPEILYSENPEFARFLLNQVYGTVESTVLDGSTLLAAGQVYYSFNAAFLRQAAEN